MAFWKNLGKVCMTPFVFVASVVSGEGGDLKDMWNDDNPKNPNTTIAETNKGLQEQAKKMEELEKKFKDSGIENFQEKVEEEVKKKLGEEPLKPREIKELIKEYPKMSEEEKKEIREKLKVQNDAYMEAVNKELKEQVQKSEQKATKAAQDLANLKNDDASSSEITAALLKAKEADKQAFALKKEFEKHQKSQQDADKRMKEMFELAEKDKGFWSDLNFSSPWAWGIIGVMLIFLIAVWFGIKWMWGKTKELIGF